MQVKHILLVGNYKAGNLGDNILGQVCFKQLTSLYPEAEIAFMCPNGDFPLFPAGIRSYLRLDFLKASKAIKWADLVVFGGGGLLNSEVPKSLKIWGKVINRAKKAGVPIIMLGQSFSEKITAELDKLISKVDFISVRDTASELVLKKLDTTVPFIQTSDLAFAYEPSSDTRFESEDFSQYALFNIREYKQLNSSDILKIAKKLIQEVLNKTSMGVYLLPFDKRDKRILSKLESFFQDTGKVKILELDLDNLASLFTGAEFIISQRLHCSLMALMFKKPVLSLSYASKTKSLLSGLGLEDFILDLRDLSSEEYEAQIDFRLEGEYLSDSELGHLKEKALSNFSILKTFVENL